MEGTSWTTGVSAFDATTSTLAFDARRHKEAGDNSGSGYATTGETSPVAAGPPGRAGSGCEA